MSSGLHSNNSPMIGQDPMEKTPSADMRDQLDQETPDLQNPSVGF